MRPARADLLDQRCEFRAHVRWRSNRCPGRRGGTARGVYPRSVERARLRGLHPHRHRPCRAHTALHRSDGRDPVRRALIDRRTHETSIRVALTLEGKGRYRVKTGIRFLDHMLELVARHGVFDLTIDANGDLDVDQHHTVEDLGITLGETV